MSGIRPMSAAELLGVSARTLRGWERRFGYPRPRRSAAGHRQYDLAEIEPLRQAVVESHSVSAAIELARERGAWSSSPTRLIDAFGRFDEGAADRVMEESLAVRSVERSVEEVLIPAVSAAAEREGWETEFQLACRWATGWLAAARRAVAPVDATAARVLLFDSSRRLEIEALRSQALELGLRRAGMQTVLLASELPHARLVATVRLLEPVAVVLCAGANRAGGIERLAAAVDQADCAALLFELGESLPVNGGTGVTPLGATIVEAVGRLRAYVQWLDDARPRGDPPIFVQDGIETRLRVAVQA
jgi:MerR family transcriptional regulator, light-induced transcriptional regulator